MRAASVYIDVDEEGGGGGGVLAAGAGKAAYEDAGAPAGLCFCWVQMMRRCREAPCVGAGMRAVLRGRGALTAPAVLTGGGRPPSPHLL